MGINAIGGRNRKRLWITTGLVTALLGAATLAPAVQAKGGDGTRIALKGSSAYQGASGKAKSKSAGERGIGPGDARHGGTAKQIVRKCIVPF